VNWDSGVVVFLGTKPASSFGGVSVGSAEPLRCGDAIYDWLGFDVVANPVLRDLVIVRIVESTSKLDSLRVLADLRAEMVSYEPLIRTFVGSTPAVTAMRSPGNASPTCRTAPG